MAALESAGGLGQLAMSECGLTGNFYLFSFIP